MINSAVRRTRSVSASAERGQASLSRTFRIKSQRIAMTSGKEKRPLLGAHMSIAGGVSRIAGARPADRLRLHPDFHQVARANGHPSHTRGEEIEAFKSAQAETGIKMVVAHDSYLLNLGAPDDKLRKRSVDGFHRRAGAMRVARRAVSDRASGLARRLGRRRRHHDRSRDRSTRRTRPAPVSRSRSRWRSPPGRAATSATRFAQMGRIFDAVKENDRLRLCFDTEHAFAAGYDLRSDEGYERTFARARRAYRHQARGRLSSQRFAQAVSTRASIATSISAKATSASSRFDRLLHDPRFFGIPMCLETEPGPDMKDIAEDLVTLRKLLESQATCSSRLTDGETNSDRRPPDRPAASRTLRRLAAKPRPPAARIRHLHPDRRRAGADRQLRASGKTRGQRLRGRARLSRGRASIRRRSRSSCNRWCRS